MQARRSHLDVLRVVGAQLIVLHHLSAYGPVAHAAHVAAPALMAWLYDYARMAVQVFLVVGGYLAAQSLAPVMRQPAASLLRTLLRRYQRLVFPFLAALVLAIGSATLARQWLHADFIPAAPSWGQILAHALLLHGVLGVDALSAGLWYVAIDFQLFALMAVLLWLGRRAGQTWLTQALVLGLMATSLFFFNRQTALDNWAIYFFGAYGMGAATSWAGHSQRCGWWLSLLTLVALAALMLDFRTRVVLALVVALLLGLSQCPRLATPALPNWLASAVHSVGKASYALFLVHFSVLMLGNALFAQLGLSSPWAASAMLLGIWACSQMLAFGFERWVESPLAATKR